jgi:nucleotide-binding universal stress UspA family protein
MPLCGNPLDDCLYAAMALAAPPLGNACATKEKSSPTTKGCESRTEVTKSRHSERRLKRTRRAALEKRYNVGPMKILLTIDHSKRSEEAVAYAALLVRPEGNEIRVLNVIEHRSVYISADLIPHRTKETIQTITSEQTDARELVDRASGSLQRAGITAKGIVESGDPKAVILAYAEKWGADLILVASRGLKGLDRLLMGSVSNAVLHHATCSVQVMRLPSARAKGIKKPQSGS